MSQELPTVSDHGVDHTSDVLGKNPVHNVTSRVARQGIFNQDVKLVAHELLFRGTSEDAACLPSDATETAEQSAHDRATSQVLTHTFGVFGIEDLSGGHPLFINMTRTFLTGEIELPFDPDGVVLEVLENIECNPELVAGIKHLKERGYRIALDDFDGKNHRPLLPYADVVKVDYSSMSESLTDLVKMVRESTEGVQLIAERIETEADFVHCKEAGFDCFQGYFFQRPVLLEFEEFSPSQVVCLKIIRLLSEGAPEPDVLESLVKADPFLALRVLRTANSVSAALSYRVSSLRQALVLIGPKGLSTWVMLTLMGGTTALEQYRVTEVLVRSNFCEQLGVLLRLDTRVCSTLGMISGLAAKIGVDIDQVARSAGLDQDLLDQISDLAGPYGKMLAEVAHYESGTLESSTLGLTSDELSTAYLNAWTNALRVTSVAAEGNIRRSGRSTS